ncbi:MAG: DUF839 domain-containing protein [Cystobacterineae bacterium]|nr:DUF839 domain-containing protein [Cystobacterineae bacterium]
MRVGKQEKQRLVGQKRGFVSYGVFLSLVALALGFVACGSEEDDDIIDGILEPEPDKANLSFFAGDRRGYADGVGAAAQFDSPRGMAMDKAGNLFVADTDNHCIRKVTPERVVSTFAGDGTPKDDSSSSRGYADGVGAAARFDTPMGITIDAADNLYVTDDGNYRIRKITPQGMVSTLAGSGEFIDSEYVIRDGPGNTAQFMNIGAITIDTQGNLYVMDDGGGKGHIRKVTPQGEVSTIYSGGFDLLRGFGLAIDTAGTLYVTGDNRISKVTQAGALSLFVGGENPENSSIDGTGSAATFRSPDSLTFDEAGNLYLIESGEVPRIRKITPAGVVSTIAFLPGSHSECTKEIVRDKAGNFYLTDHRRICKVTFSK